MRFWLYLLICSLVFTNVSFCSTYDVIYRTSADPVTRSISVSPSDLDIVYSTSKDSGYVYTTSTEPDYTNKISQESHSTGSYYVGSQGPAITIEKYTNGFKNNYKKNDIITVKIRIINNNKENRLKNVYILEEIPEGFEFIEASPLNSTIPNKPNTIIWNCGDEIRSTKTYEYSIKTNKSGEHNFGSTMLEATVMDKNGRKNEIIITSNRFISITVSNNAPEFESLNPEAPINVRRHLRGYFIGHKPKYINVSLVDPDNDAITCKLLSSSGCKAIEPIPNSINPDTNCECIYYNYTFDISKLNRGSHILTLDAFDGDEHKYFRDIELNIYIIPQKITSAFYTLIIIVIAGVIVRHSFIYSLLSHLKDKLRSGKRSDNSNSEDSDSSTTIPDDSLFEEQKKKHNPTENLNETFDPEQ